MRKIEAKKLNLIIEELGKAIESRNGIKIIEIAIKLYAEYKSTKGSMSVR
jgi:hypothetical protein